MADLILESKTSISEFNALSINVPKDAKSEGILNI